MNHIEHNYAAPCADESDTREAEPTQQSSGRQSEESPNEPETAVLKSTVSNAQMEIDCDLNESTMCAEHPLWDDFMDRLVGEEGCNYHSVSQTEIGPLAWNCSGSAEYPFSRKILGDMGLTSSEIDASLLYFSGHGGSCDCEVVLNVEDNAASGN